MKTRRILALVLAMVMLLSMAACAKKQPTASQAAPNVQTAQKNGQPAQNNNLGTVGIAYNTKIMPVKAVMASGVLNQSNIAKAINFTYENGAEVINMSFGGTACSIMVQDALAVCLLPV